jgi:hypothetical protein
VSWVSPGLGRGGEVVSRPTDWVDRRSQGEVRWCGLGFCPRKTRKGTQERGGRGRRGIGLPARGDARAPFLAGRRAGGGISGLPPGGLADSLGVTLLRL